jgi:hypothetical protein
MSVIVRSEEAEKCELLSSDDPKKPIAQAWVQFLEFHYNSRKLVDSGQTEDCRKLYGPEPKPGVRGNQLFLASECCDGHREQMKLKEKTIALLEEHGFNVSVEFSDRHGTRSVHVLSEDWWKFHGYEWDILTPIVMDSTETAEV